MSSLTATGHMTSAVHQVFDRCRYRPTAARPDASQRCNFRFRLANCPTGNAKVASCLLSAAVFLHVLFPSLVLAAPVSISPPPLPCRTVAAADAFASDPVSQAVLASIVFEGQVTSVSSADSCLISYKVRRLFKGDLPTASISESRPLPADDAVSTTTSASSVTEKKADTVSSTSTSSLSLFERVYVRVGDDCSNLRNEHIREKTHYLVFLSNVTMQLEAGGNGSDGRHVNTASTNSLPTPRSLSRRHVATTVPPPSVVYQFSSMPLTSNNGYAKLLANISQAKFARAPGAVLTGNAKNRPQKQLKSSTGSTASVSKVSLPSGARLQLTCRAMKGRPVASVFLWEKDGRCLESAQSGSRSNNRISIQHNKAKMSSKLMIKALTADDAGVYGCIVVNVVGHSTLQTIVVDVTPSKKPQSPSKPPTDNSDQTVESTPTVASRERMRRCDAKDERYCLNGGQCYIVTKLSSKICRCKPGYEGHRCQEVSNGLDPEVDIGNNNILMTLLRKKRMHAAVT